MAKQPIAPIRSISEADEETLTAMIAWWNKRPKKYEDSAPPRAMNASDVHLVEMIDAVPARSGMVVQKGQARLIRPIMDEITEDPADITLEYVAVDGIPYEITVWNTTETALAADAMIHVKRLKYGIWVPDSGGGTVVLRHAVVTRVCNTDCSTYEIEFVDRSFSEECDGGTQTGSGT